MKKYQIILVLSCIVIVMGFIKLTYKYDPGSATEQPIKAIVTAVPTPIPTSGEDLSPVPDVNDEKYPAWKLLPYYGQGFVVDRYVAPMTIAVKPKGLDKKLVEIEVKKWLTENKFDGAGHKIQWE